MLMRDSEKESYVAGRLEELNKESRAVLAARLIAVAEGIMAGRLASGAFAIRQTFATPSGAPASSSKNAPFEALQGEALAFVLDIDE